MPGLGRALVVAGVALVAAGLLVLLLTRFSVPLGHLPGDITWRGRGWRVSVPLATSLLLSVLLTVLLWVVSRLR